MATAETRRKEDEARYITTHYKYITMAVQSITLIEILYKAMVFNHTNILQIRNYCFKLEGTYLVPLICSLLVRNFMSSLICL
jgi:hypothetical protein